MPASLAPLMLATRNAGKIRELAEPLAACGFAVQCPPADLPEVEETGLTFAENALLKAHAVADATGLPALADDSGLEVDDLNGDPGVRSARYGDDIPQLEGESKDQRNNRKLLATLGSLPSPLPRGGKARFHCCMALVWPHTPDVTPDASSSKNVHADIVVHGVWEGSMVATPRGAEGFGYDPLFEDAATGKTAAELSLEEKRLVSHRGKALCLLLDELKRV